MKISHNEETIDVKSNEDIVLNSEHTVDRNLCCLYAYCLIVYFPNHAASVDKGVQILTNLNGCSFRC